MNTINIFFRGNHLSDIDRTGRMVAVISAIIGVGILLGFYLTKSDFFVTKGLYFLVIAFIINSILVLILLISIFTEKEKNNTTNNFTTIGFMLFNIPLVAICGVVALKLYIKY